MTTEYKIVYTPAFKTTLSRLTYFLEKNYSTELALQVKKEIRSAINTSLKSNPFLGPISDRLADLGITQYRQWLVDQHNLVFYKIEAEHIVVLAVINTRQSIRDVLYDVLLRY